MMVLPLNRSALLAAKFCVLLSYLFMEIAVFLIVFVITGLIATSSTGITETLPDSVICLSGVLDYFLQCFPVLQ